jgi:Tol biopolymer transport system component
LCASDGSRPRRLTDQGHAIFPVWSPSGESLAFMSNLNVHVMDMSGGFSKNPTAGSTVPSSFPSWSADGRWIYFIRAIEGSPQVVKMRAEGGEVFPLTHGTGFRSRPFETQDGRVVYSRGDRLWSVPVRGGEESLVLDKSVRFNQWCLWNDRIVFILDKPQPWIEMVDMATGATTRILEIEKTTVFYRSSITVSPDGQWILFARLGQAGSDLVLVENFL